MRRLGTDSVNETTTAGDHPLVQGSRRTVPRLAAALALCALLATLWWLLRPPGRGGQEITVVVQRLDDSLLTWHRMGVVEFLVDVGYD
ncbi:MAG: hypothetical protein ACE5JG_00905, partial [Planctomycetota bacterium]